MTAPDTDRPVLYAIFGGGAGFYARWTRRLTRSEFGSVCVADPYAGVVLVNTVDGDELWPLDRFASFGRRLRCVIHVPVYGLMPEFVPDDGARRSLSILLRWLSGGRLFRSAHDCVIMSCTVIRACGVFIPPRICTPVALHDWLLNRGYHHEELGTHAARPRARALADDPRRLRQPVPGVQLPGPSGR